MSAICLTLCSFIDVADLEGNTQAIKRFINQDNEEDVNLDNSVFMNFVRYNRSSIEACFQTDWKNSVMDHIIQDQQLTAEVAEEFRKNYVSYCKFFHEVSANYTSFPNIAMKDLAHVLLYKLGSFNEDFSKVVADEVIEEYKEYRPEVYVDKLLNRVSFCEVLILCLQKQQASRGDSERALTLANKVHNTFIHDIRP